MEKPLRSMTLGYALRFKQNEGAYGLVVAKSCLEAFRRMHYSGRCEYFDRDEDQYNDYIVGIALRHKYHPYTPDPHWWDAYVQGVIDALDGKLHVYRTSCEFARLRALRATFSFCGAVVFEDGVPLRILEEDEGSLFVAVCREFLADVA